MNDAFNQRTGFTLPTRRDRASRRRRRMVVQAFAAVALIASITVAAVAVSIGIARANARPPARPAIAATCAGAPCAKPAY